MKCPKCGYLGFEHVDRCRNCGYDFSLAQSPPAPELPLKHDSQQDISRLELPLFSGPLAEDEPLITRSSRPRPPLAVRRATPEVPRLRAGQLRTQALDLDLEPATSAGCSDEVHAVAPMEGTTARDAGVGARLLAVVIDLLILAVVDALVVYFTMQICGLTIWDLGVLPKGPLLAFLLIQNGGYLVVFTAGGQTLGKMAAGIKVVPAGSDEPLELGRALLRTLIWLVLAVPAGLGFLTAVLSRDHRGLHDRVAGTRVVR